MIKVYRGAIYREAFIFLSNFIKNCGCKDTIIFFCMKKLGIYHKKALPLQA